MVGAAVAVLSVSMLLLDSPLDFILLSLSMLDVDLSFSTNAAEGPGTGGVDGVFEPESVKGGLSVHIFSLSLSDSSPLVLMLLVDACR